MLSTNLHFYGILVIKNGRVDAKILKAVKGKVSSMLEQMFRASQAVLLRPSVSTFEEYERNNLGWATIYVLIGSVVASLLGLVGSLLQRTSLEQQLADFEQELGSLPGWLTTLVLSDNSLVTILSNLISALVVFFIFLFVIYLLGLLVGGNGAFGELAYDVALFWTPISVISALLSALAIGPLACISGPLLLIVGIYNVYLTFLSIQSGMNLSTGKALITVLMPVFILLIMLCGLVALFIAEVSPN